MNLKQGEIVLRQFWKFLDATLFIGMVDALYPKTLKHIEQIASEIPFHVSTAEGGQSLLARVTAEIKTAVDGCQLEALLFSLAGRELLIQASEDNEIEYWQASHHVNSLNTLGQIASEVEFRPVLLDDLERLLWAYALAERHSFLSHNLDVARLIALEVPLEVLVHRAIEPPYLEAHWQEIAQSARIYQNYSYESGYKNEIEKKLSEEKSKLSDEEALVMRNAFGFDWTDFGSLAGLALVAARQDPVMPIDRRLFTTLGEGSVQGKRSVLDQFSWSPARKHELGPWRAEFRPLIELPLEDFPVILMTPYATIAAITAFHNVLRTAAHLEYYVGKGQAKQFTQSSHKMRKYYTTEFCYMVADSLAARGLDLPSQGGIPRVEIKKLKDVATGQWVRVGHPSDLGDIDVLAFDRRRKEIVLVECKVFRLGVTPKQFFEIDLDKAEQAVRKVLARHEWASANKALLCTTIQLAPDDEVQLRSLIVTARPNYLASLGSEARVRVRSFGQLLTDYQRESSES